MEVAAEKAMDDPNVEKGLTGTPNNALSHTDTYNDADDIIHMSFGRYLYQAFFGVPTREFAFRVTVLLVLLVEAILASYQHYSCKKSGRYPMCNSPDVFALICMTSNLFFTRFWCLRSGAGRNVQVATGIALAASCACAGYFLMVFWVLEPPVW